MSKIAVMTDSNSGITQIEAKEMGIPIPAVTFERMGASAVILSGVETSAPRYIIQKLRAEAFCFCMFQELGRIAAFQCLVSLRIDRKSVV